MTNEKAIMCLEDMKIKVPIPKAAKQARENNEALDVAIKALAESEHSTNLAEVGTDCISRQAAIDGIEKRQMNIMRTTVLIDQMRFDGLADALDIIKQLPAAQPEPCEDAVNRETLLKFFDGWMSALDENCHNQSVSDLKIIKRDFANLPPVTPKQRTGKWIYQIGMVKCNQCLRAIRRIDHDGLLNFCPNCGAKMKGVSNES